MKIVKETPAELILNLAGQTGLLAVGLILLLAGLLTLLWIRPQPLSWTEAEALSQLQQQSQDTQFKPDYQNPSTGVVGLNLAGYVKTLLFEGKWLFFLLGLLGLVVGGVIVVSPTGYGGKVTFDKSAGQIRLRQPGWFFRSHLETAPFQSISEVRVERDSTSISQSDRNYRLSLVLSHSEGTPLSSNYVHYKTVFPFSSYRHDYQTAQNMASRIQLFLKNLTESTIQT